MKHNLTIDRALQDPQLLGAALGPVDPTWLTWLVVLRAAYGLPLTEEELRIFHAVAGDRTPPTRRVPGAMGGVWQTRRKIQNGCSTRLLCRIVRAAPGSAWRKVDGARIERLARSKQISFPICESFLGSLAGVVQGDRRLNPV